MPRAAVIANPLRVPDSAAHRAEVAAELARLGWDEPLWFDTTAEDAGVGMTRKALAEGVDLVFSSGGDGTVRACAEALMDTGVPLALLFGGTGNLLARNLGLPIGIPDAIRVGVEGETRAIDVGMLDDLPFVVMAGLGLDAAMADSTTTEAKRRIGWLAYVGGVLRHIADRPFRATIRLDGRAPIRRRARMVLVGNVGQLQGGLRLLPEAAPDDGLLDVLVLTPRTPMDWLRVVGHVVTRSKGHEPRAERYTASRVSIAVSPAVLSECDGDPVGHRGEVTVTTRPKALLLRTPRETED
ncbi:diacylglycerol kinase family lipid kinase [Sphaerisporangium sp. TRM90804]|uniref:diacylglycerol/lipid kinase family protein n=1 Tax=Sphaerisporangium sp. TRM90804 TaxID=3031113 RepID=UPI00244A364F|nr:diacylglycerol kinase family lipid kinase [Sphaerisporangium sp. TRM90804]MDH2428049.1 diacylglycerol kinase family lipid kinase [Sphaerisporangium sp. TRM90804]